MTSSIIEERPMLGGVERRTFESGGRKKCEHVILLGRAQEAPFSRRR